MKVTVIMGKIGCVWLFILPFLSLITCDTDGGSYSSLSDVTLKIFGAPKDGIVAAFGDFNSDQHVDIFFIIDEGKFTRSLLLKC